METPLSTGNIVAGSLPAPAVTEGRHGRHAPPQRRLPPCSRQLNSPPARGSAHSAASPNPGSVFGKDRVVARASTLSCYGSSALAPIHSGTTPPSRVLVFQKQKDSAAARLVGQSAIILRTPRLSQWRIGLKHQPVPLGIAGTWTMSLCAVIAQGSVCFNLTPFRFSCLFGVRSFADLFPPGRSCAGVAWEVPRRHWLAERPACSITPNRRQHQKMVGTGVPGVFATRRRGHAAVREKERLFLLSRSWRHSASGPQALSEPVLTGHRHGRSGEKAHPSLCEWPRPLSDARGYRALAGPGL